MTNAETHRVNLPILPSLEDLLDKVDVKEESIPDTEQRFKFYALLNMTLSRTKTQAQQTLGTWLRGSLVIRFDMKFPSSVKACDVEQLCQELEHSMATGPIRVVKGRARQCIGIELPHNKRNIIRLIELLEASVYPESNGQIIVALGKDIGGCAVFTDWDKARHMLVAGTVGSGKTAAINVMIASMLLKYTSDQLRLILIDSDPQGLYAYNHIPHLLTPVVTNVNDAMSALNWCFNEMEDRCKLMALLNVADITSYNLKIGSVSARGDDLPTQGVQAARLTPLPRIVVVVNELALLTKWGGKKFEEKIACLVKVAHKTGIHLLLTTQYPVAEEFMQLIKADIPTRLAFCLNNNIESHTILGESGAEKLLGDGDMLLMEADNTELERLCGAFISDDEINRICNACREIGSPNYISEILTCTDDPNMAVVDGKEQEA